MRSLGLTRGAAPLPLLPRDRALLLPGGAGGPGRAQGDACTGLVRQRTLGPCGRGWRLIALPPDDGLRVAERHTG